MNQLLIIVGLAISISSTGQQLTYKGDIVDTVKIISNSSYYHFDSCGTTSGIYEEYIIAYNKEKKNYILNPYQRTEYKFTFKPETSLKKEKKLKKGNVVDQLLISNLLEQFEISYRKPSFENIGISKDAFLKLTDKKHIIQVAKWHQSDWKFGKLYFTKEENEKIYRGCQSTDTFNLYLACSFDTAGYSMITDADDHFDVIFSTAQNKYRFEGKYPNSFKQPWYSYLNIEGFPSASVLNFSINSALVEILPSNFSRVNTLKFEALTNEYIEWYLKRRGVIF